MQYIIYYLFAGTIWTAFLEYYTTTKLKGPASVPWEVVERLLHILFWPIGFLVFTYNFIKGIISGE